MSVCRTCLSKNDLRPIFIDKNFFAPRITELYTVTGIKIEPNDGFSQTICDQCTHLIKIAIQFREISSKANEFFKNTHKYATSLQTNDIAKFDIYQKDVRGISKKKELNKQPEIKTKKNTVLGKGHHIKIEDFESSDDGPSMGDIVMEDLESNDEEKVCIEDYESSDSFGTEEFVTIANVMKEDSKEVYAYNQTMKEKQLLERERRKLETRKLDQKLMALAVTPYDPGGPIRCSLCTTVLRSAANFKNHARTHYGLQNACDDCGKKFMTLSHVRYHQQRVHGRQKRLACSRCAYRAVDLQQLQNHERATHTGERPFTCDVCGDSFRMRRNIVQHMRKHFGVRNLQCERCPVMFRSRSELAGHQSKVHNHVYTYHCYLCAETYKRPASVKKHLFTSHGVPKDQQANIECVKTKRNPEE